MKRGVVKGGFRERGCHEGGAVENPTPFLVNKGAVRILLECFLVIINS